MLKPAAAIGELQGIDLRHERVCGEALGSTELHRALLDFADFTGAKLARTNLSNGRLRFAALSGADLESADLFEADLRHARLDRTDLRTAKLNGAQLEHADFAGANLANADLHGQSLRFVHLAEASLSTANLAGTDLRHACLQRADLRGADLRGALLDYADLSGANLAGADLRGASLRYTSNIHRAHIRKSVVDETTVMPVWFDQPVLGVRRRRHRFPRVRSAMIAGASAAGACALLWLGAITLDRATRNMTATVPSVAASLQGDVSTAPPSVLHVPADRTAWALPPRVLDVRSGPPGQEVKWGGLPELDVAATREEVQIRGAKTHSTPPLHLAVLVVPGTGQSDVRPINVDINLQPELMSRAVKGSAAELGQVHDWPALALNSVSLDHETTAVSDLPVLAALGDSTNTLVPQRDSAIEVIAIPIKLEPLTLVVSLDRQRLDVYRGAELIDTAKISSGKRGHETRAGVFSILQKRRDHRSNLYDGAPMPWMQRLTRTGTALHGGRVPGYPASHGCVRLPHGFAAKLFEMTSVGENVVVAAEHTVPKVIEHSLLSTLTQRPTPAPVAAETRNSPVANLKRGVPLRILVTRRTDRDRAIDVQYLLASMGYLRPQNFTGRIGSETIEAIKAFQRASDLAVTGSFDDALVKQVYDAAEKEEPPEGRIFIRQQFNRVLDVPVTFRDPSRPLGTQLFSAVGQEDESGKLQWTAVRLEGDQPAHVLDRIAIPDSVRRVIAGFVMPGSSLIVADKSINSAILPEGDDFLVWAKHSPSAAILKSKPATATAPREVRKTVRAKHPPKAKSKKAAAARKARTPVSRRPSPTTRERTVQRQVVRPSSGPFGLFSRRR